jgi:hypothetical protein
MINIDRPKIKNIVFVAGPGGSAFNSNSVKNYVDNLKAAGAQVTLVGDGESHISLAEVKEAIAVQGGPTTVIVNAHGKLQNGEAALEFGEKDLLLRDFLQASQDEAGQNIYLDYFIASCNVDGIHQQINPYLLHPGQIMVTLSGANINSKFTSGFDVERFYNSLTDNKCYKKTGFGANHLLYDYLLTDLKNRIAPSVTIGGKGEYNLDEIFKNNLGFDYKHIIDHKLSECYQSDHFDKVLNKLSNAEHEWNIYALDYGAALAISFNALDPLADRYNIDSFASTNQILGADCLSD